MGKTKRAREIKTKLDKYKHNDYNTNKSQNRQSNNEANQDKTKNLNIG